VLRRSQCEASDLARMVHPGRRGHKIVAVLQFKFDESYDGKVISQVMSVGGWIANESEWRRLESRWARRVDFENRHSRPDQQITRFHAAEMNCKGGEYKNWDKQMCLQLSKKLIALIAKRKIGAVAIGCDIEAVQSVFPKGDIEGMARRAYVLCMKQLMVEIAHILEKHFPGDTVLLIHDHGNWDDAALEGYNLLVDDPDWPRRGLFEGLVARTGGTDIGLQVADMISYECFKAIKAKKISSDAGMRGAMREFLKHEVPISAKWIDIKAAQAFYKVMKESGKYPNLDNCGLV